MAVDSDTPKHTRTQWAYLVCLCASGLLVAFVPEEYEDAALIGIFALTFGAELIGVRLRWEGIRYAPLWLVLMLAVAVHLYFERGAKPALVTAGVGFALVPVTLVVHRVRETRRDALVFAELRATRLERFDPRGEYGWQQLAECVFIPRAAAWDPAMCQHNREIGLLARRWLLERGAKQVVDGQLVPLIEVFVAGARSQAAIDDRRCSAAAAALVELIRARGEAG